MKEALLKLHLSVLIAGGTGVFGRLITLGEGLLVWYRLLLATLMFYAVLFVLNKIRKVQRTDVVKIASTGVLLAMHWLFFYGSIKASNVSIGVVWLINRRRISIGEILFSLIGVAGIVLIFHFDTRYRTGILMGVLSSALASLFTICNKRVASDYPSGTVLLYEMGGGFVGLSLLLPFYLHFFPVETLVPSASDWASLLVLASLCTVCLYILQIQVLKKVSAFTFNLTYNLEPIYSIILAMIIFGEAKDLNFSFYTGLGLIFLSVALQTYRIIGEMKK